MLTESCLRDYLVLGKPRPCALDRALHDILHDTRGCTPCGPKSIWLHKQIQADDVNKLDFIPSTCPKHATTRFAFILHPGLCSTSLRNALFKHRGNCVHIALMSNMQTHLILVYSLARDSAAELKSSRRVHAAPIHVPASTTWQVPKRA